MAAASTGGRKYGAGRVRRNASQFRQRVLVTSMCESMRRGFGGLGEIQIRTGSTTTREDVAMTLPVGLALPTTPELTRPSALAELARAAEQFGYAHLWVSDHVLLPSGSHVAADHQLDPFASLAWLAAQTRQIRLGTSVLVLPYRGAAATAKTLATIDWLSGGRLIVGVGAGWLRAE